MLIPDWTTRYIAIPFLEHGRDRDGCDCWGLCRLIWREQFGLDLPSYGETYNTAEDGRRVGETLAQNGIDSTEWMQIQAGDEVAGDAVLLSGFYKVDGALRKANMHVGLVVRPGFMIHVEAGITTCIARYRDDRRFNRRVKGFFRNQKLKSRIENPE